MYSFQLLRGVRRYGVRMLCVILCSPGLHTYCWPQAADTTTTSTQQATPQQTTPQQTTPPQVVTQQTVPQQTVPQQIVPQQIVPLRLPDAGQETGPRPATPTLGVGDEGEITIYGVVELGVPDMNEHFVVNSSGEIWAPLLGKVAVAGLTLESAQAMIEQRLANEGYLKDPHVSLSVKDYINDRVLIVGEVNKPGAYSSRNSPRLFDLFNTAGGLTARAGNTVTITHPGHPKEPESITLSNDPAVAAKNDVWLRAGDTVEVSRAGIVYVLGEVNRAGGFVMEKDKMTALEVVAMASGPTHLASMSHVQLIRRTSSGLNSKIVNLKKIIDAKAPDFALQAEDILFVPSSKGKTLAQIGAPTLLSTAASLAIYHF